MEVARRGFDHTLELGVIRPSYTNWSELLHLASKQDIDEWRPCGDYRDLNAVTTPDEYPLPHIHDFRVHIAGTKIYSRIDLMTGYNEIAVDPSDAPKTAVTIPVALVKLVRMPDGLKDGVQAFQRFMDGVTRGLRFIFVYREEIRFASRTAKEHEERLRLLFEELDEHSLVIKPHKYIFVAEPLDLHGHRISPHGVKPIESRVRAIDDFPVPTSFRKLRELLGLINAQRRFIPACPQVLRPLTDLLRRDSKEPPTFQ